jgi:PAS domain S-box-containing protein
MSTRPADADDDRQLAPFDRLERLQAVTAALSKALTPAEVVEAVVEQGMAALGARAGLVALVTPDGIDLEIIKTRGFAEETMRAWHRFPIAAGLPLSDVVRRAAPLFIETAAEYRARYPEMARRVGATIRAAAALPLVARGKAFGGLYFAFPGERPFPDEDRAFLSGLAHQCELALERARLYEVEQTARREAEDRERRAALLSDVSALLYASLDYTETLSAVARLTVPRFADWCAVDLVDEAGVPQRAAVEHVDPAKAAWGWELHRRYPPRPDVPRGIPAVLRKGEPEFLPTVTDEMLAAAARDEEHLRLLREIGPTSAILVPLAARGRVFGALSLVATRESGRQFAEEDLALAVEIGRRAALAIDNALLFRAAEQARRTAESVLESIGEMFFSLDADWRFTYVNARARALWGKTPEELLGRSAWDVFPEARGVFPEARGSIFQEMYERALAEQRVVEFEVDLGPRLGWFEVRVYPSPPPAPSGLSVFFRNITERKQAEIERERLFVEARARAEREALVNRIGDGIRQALDPAGVEALAVEELGRALKADRCYLMAVDLARDAIAITRDWYAEGVPSLAGQYRVSDLGVDFAGLFAAGETLVVSDARPESERRLFEQNAATNERVGVSSFVNVPFFEGDHIVGALGVAMAGGAREWTADEVTLAETVAGQLRSAVEAVRLRQRERMIADQLQEALIPTPPDALPGMTLARFYRPALEEAGVGGDFWDVFPLDKGCTALVVADVSGKGLAAAGQVATVRNMLRYALYTGHTLAQSITTLNLVLAEKDVLSGFATLFVGVYDHARRTLTYVNGGQEPALVWRAATGDVGEIGPTGPVLGGFDGGAFDERVLALLPGDVLAIFTDGLTDVGPNRRTLLGVSGVSSLLSECCDALTARADRSAAPDAVPDDTESDDTARYVLSCLMAGANAFGRGGLRDDVAVLVGVISHAPESSPDVSGSSERRGAPEDVGRRGGPDAAPALVASGATA